MGKIVTTLSKYRLLIYAALILIAGLYVSTKIKKYLADRKRNDQELAIVLKQLQSLKTTNGQLVQETDIIRHKSSEQLKKASDSIFKLADKNKKLVKEVSRLQVLAQDIRLGDTVFIPFPDSAKVSPNLACDSIRSLLPKMVLTPLDLEYNSDSLIVTETLLPTGLAITGLVMPDTFTERDVMRKTGFLKLGRKYTTEYHHSNSMIRINGAAVYTVDKTPSWWYRTGKPVGVGIISSAIASFIAYSLLNKR